MTKEELKAYKENKDIKFIYKIPCSLYIDFDNIEYIIVGNISTNTKENIRMFSLDDWFLRMIAGSLLPYVCSTLPRSCKVKEYLNIYDKPNLSVFRKFILSIDNSFEIIQECLWAIQIIEESKVNRPNVFTKLYKEQDVLNMFLTAVDPIYKMSLNER